MIRRKLLIATAIIASVVITACSDMTAPKKLVPGGLPAAAILAPHPVAGLAATVVATINGGGTAEMEVPGFLGSTAFGMEVKLLADGSATGHFDCLDQHGSTHPGNIFGEVTSWSNVGTKAEPIIVLHVTGKVVGFPAPGHPRDVSFTVTIQKFGGAGVGHWTLTNAKGRIVCFETLTSGQIVIRWA
jgi:hypothetical protein